MGENKHTKQDLQLLQALPLEVKVMKTKQRIREWVDHFGEEGVYVSFSGGKDSLALLHIVREMYPNIKAMHVNTGLEFPEIEKFVAQFNNVDIIKPKMTFVETVKKYGYPLISKEVAECVYGARKYLNYVIEQNNISQTDRQTDRQTISGTSRSIVSYADVVSTRNAIERRYGGVGLSETSQTLLESELLMELLTQDYTKTIDNLRVQRLMGINRKDGKATAETIPSAKDRSAFSCERYQFMLDAPFEVCQQCCRIIKKNPAHQYCKDTGRMPITAQTASESRLRTQAWLKNGCNGFDLKYPISNPMSFWFENDILTYLKMHDIKLCSVYGDIVSDDEESMQLSLDDIYGTGIFDQKRPEYHTTGCGRTGCVACGFGLHHESCKEKSRIQNIIDFSNPKYADWMLRGGKFDSDGLWKPYQGLGYCFIFEWMNKHGNMHYWYPNREHYIKQLPTECWKYLDDGFGERSLMKHNQYCRYCVNLVTGNGIYCTALNKEKSEASTKAVNYCKHFEFCEIDAYDLKRKYKPKERKPRDSS